MEDILFALWFFAAAGIANTSPVFAARVKALDWLGKPIDRGMTFRGKRLLGQNKTVRGFVSAFFSGVGIAVVQMVVYSNNSWVVSVTDTIDYSDPSVLVLGGLLGLGAIVGDAVKSFFKRQLAVAPGKTWFPFDQADYIIGGITFSLFYTVLPLEIYLLVFGLYFLLHLATVYIGWRLHLRDAPI